MINSIIFCLFFAKIHDYLQIMNLFDMLNEVIKLKN